MIANKVKFIPSSLSDADFTSFQKEGEIKVSKFGKSPDNKYISVISDSEFVIEDNSRYKYLATYISKEGKITGIKIQRYRKIKKQLEPNSCITLPFKQIETLANFLKFLNLANLDTLASANFVLADNLDLDPSLYSKLVALSSDLNGKKILLQLFDSGYLTGDLDIPDLIKRGLSQTRINEKLNAIKELEELIKDPEVKEVRDIQTVLKKNPWVFGPEYKSLDFRDAGFAGKPDGRLLRIDGLSDILEVKLPNQELLRVDTQSRQFISPQLAEALGQLTGYLEYYYSEYSHERSDQDGQEILSDRYGKYYKPKGILLIGRRGKEMVNSTAQTISAEPKNMRRLLSYFHWVEVLTYDDLIERARNGITNLTNQQL